MSEYNPIDRALLTRCKWCGSEVNREEAGGIVYNCWTFLKDGKWQQSGVCIGRWRPIRIAELEAERDRLQAENAALRADFDDWDAEPDLLAECVHRLKEALGSQSGMSLPEDFEHAMNTIGKMQAENAALRDAVVSLKSLWPAERWATLSGIVRDHPCIEMAAKAAGGEK